MHKIPLQNTFVADCYTSHFNRCLLSDSALNEVNPLKIVTTQLLEIRFNTILKIIFDPPKSS
jgi:hypothetical protein